MSSSGHSADASHQGAKDIQMQDVSFKVFRKTNELTANMRALAESQDAHLYPSEIEMVEGKPLSTAGVFDLRGADVPDNLPKYAKEGNRRECVLGLQQPDPDMDEADMMPDDELHQPPPPVFVGASIKLPEEASKKSKKQGQAKANKRKKNKGHGPNLQARKGASSPVPKDCVKIAFHLDSQSPHIEIMTRKYGGDEKQHDRLVLHLFARDLELNSEEKLYLDVEPVGPYSSPRWNTDKWEEDETSNISGNVHATELNDMREANQLIKLTFAVKPALRDWSGATVMEMFDIRNRNREESIKDNTLTRDLAVQQLDKAQFIHVLFPLHNEQDRKYWERVEAYIRTVFTLAKHLGNFWFYRYQLLKAGLNPADIQGSALPKINFAIPRWLVEMWEFEGQRDTDGNFQWVRATPCSWKYHKFSSAYNDPDEVAFLVKLGIEGEETRHNRDLHELVQNKNGNYFRGFWTELEPGRYCVQIFMAIDERFDERNIKIPSLGTRVVIAVDPQSPSTPVDNRLRSFCGVVCKDVFRNEASFVCVVWGRTLDKELFPMRREYPVRVEYILDNVLYARQMLAIREIQEIPSDNKNPGVDLKALFLGCRRQALDTNFIARKTSPEALQALTTYLKDRRANKAQTDAVLATVTSPTGLTVIQGPPGTGKTDAAVSITRAYVGMGLKVMCAAPMNGAVIDLHDSFEKSMHIGNNTTIPSHCYVLFTDAQCSVKGAERLRLAEELRANDSGASQGDINTMLDADNIAAQYDRISTSSKVPGHEHTFGAKLRKQIGWWSDQLPNPTQPWLAMARDYVKYEAQLSVTHHWGNKKEIQEFLTDIEESLGHYYLKNVVMVVFVTLSSSAHTTLVRSFDPIELIIEEATHESLAGLAVPCGAFKHSIRHITLAGDYNQGKPVYIAKDSNLGHGALSHNLFAELAKDPGGQHPVHILSEGHRMVPGLLKFLLQFHPKGSLRAWDGAHHIDKPLQNMLQEFWAARLRSNFQGKSSTVCIDVSGSENPHERVTNSTTWCNPHEARVVSELVEEMLAFKPTGKHSRQMEPQDIAIITPYPGQVLAIRQALYNKGIRNITKLWTTSLTQKKQSNITIFSMVVNTGITRPTTGDRIPINLLADKHNIYMSLSRARCGRFIVGNFRCFAQMALDKHPQVPRFDKFFGLVRTLMNADQIVTEREWNFWLDNKTKPIFEQHGVGDARAFYQTLVHQKNL